MMFFLLVFSPTVFIIAMLYYYLYRPLKARIVRQREAIFTFQGQVQELEIQLQEERRLRADLEKWIEIECYAQKTIVLERALKQRIAERLEVMRQLRAERQQLYRQ